MADGDVLVDTDATLGDGEKIRLFAVESSTYPGGVNTGSSITTPTLAIRSCVSTIHRSRPTARVTTAATSGLTARNR